MFVKCDVKIVIWKMCYVNVVLFSCVFVQIKLVSELAYACMLAIAGLYIQSESLLFEGYTIYTRYIYNP